jgi:hypothetical protein
MEFKSDGDLLNHADEETENKVVHIDPKIKIWMKSQSDIDQVDDESTDLLDEERVGKLIFSIWLNFPMGI